MRIIISFPMFAGAWQSPGNFLRKYDSNILSKWNYHVTLDDTLFHRSGRKINGLAWWYLGFPPASQARFASATFL